MQKETFSNNSKLHFNDSVVAGELVMLEGLEFYCIKNYDLMAPFFMSIVSDSDHWMFISSTGGVTAGRINPESALFPYYTDDKIHESGDATGSKTIIRATIDGKDNLWEPFSERYAGLYKISRNIYKNSLGNRIVFEEVNAELNLTFRYSWMNSEKFGWIKKSTVLNTGTSAVKLTVLDGMQNILPYGTQRTMQAMTSTLIDAYKKTELVKESGLALFRLSSIPVDRAEPSEALKVTTIWSSGLSVKNYLLSTNQLNLFRKGVSLTDESQTRGIKGAFFVVSDIELPSKGSKDWYFSAEVNQDVVMVKSLIKTLKDTSNIGLVIEQNVQDGSQALINLVALSDGLQVTADTLTGNRHFANVMFNIMRGGVFYKGYAIDKADFIAHVKQSNSSVYNEFASKLASLPVELTYSELILTVNSWKSADLVRLSYEYLPLTFSRRHGDPSRPWNLFNIKLKNADGSPSLYYQGNWRDISQNWEALAMSYPGYLKGMISKFMNATTIDGYNPYRITRDGFDWEIHDPSDPWSNIGYWGDHQIIYLLKLLELQDKFYPQALQSMMGETIYSYANVPYRIKSYRELLANPQDTILFDEDLQVLIDERVERVGADGKLITAGNGSVLKVSFIEKVLSPLLSKLSNFIPGAGIWMNTQRPEWNDANNALVGYGVSMVTLSYMRRYVDFFQKMVAKSNDSNFVLSDEVVTLLKAINTVLVANSSVITGEIGNVQRKQIVDALGDAGSKFRSSVYAGVTEKKANVTKAELADFLTLAQSYIDHTINLNKRADGMYNAYNLLVIGEKEMGVRFLNEMLEGQVAMLTSGKLTTAETIALLEKLFTGSMYRADQKSFTLYPDKELALFLEKNNIKKSAIDKSPFLQTLSSKGNGDIVVKDVDGIYHFNGAFANAKMLNEAIDKVVSSGLGAISSVDRLYVLDLYESLFDHQSFTGRSGTFYKYEGLGCIYWHMVSKLLLSVGESIDWAIRSGASTAEIKKLKEIYVLVKDGIGTHKSPADYGAFPTDPYSHTPSMAGVQQPGMTGQVKEDVLSRFMELGVKISNGIISFSPVLLKKSEFITNSTTVDSSHFTKKYPSVKIGTNNLAFSICNVPVIYSIGTKSETKVTLTDGKVVECALELSAELSGDIFSRSGKIAKIEVTIPQTSLEG